jgi:hypothetical protein
MGVRPIVVRPGEGHRVGNVEFLARTADTPRFTRAIIEIAPGRQQEARVHAAEDDAFYIVEGEMTFVFGDETAAAAPGTFVLGPARRSARLSQRGRRTGSDAQHSRSRRLRSAHRSIRLNCPARSLAPASLLLRAPSRTGTGSESVSGRSVAGLPPPPFPGPVG